MRSGNRNLCILFVLFLLVTSLANAATYVDMAGRKVTIPKRMEKVYATSAIGALFIYTLAPEKAAGLIWAPTESERRFLLSSYLDLPIMGSAYGGKRSSINIEELIKRHPDLILSIGGKDEATISAADELQDKTGIPVIVLDGALDRIPAGYRELGKLLGVKERAEELATYGEYILRKSAEAAAHSPKKVRVYYAEGNDGFETDPSGSDHTEVLTAAGGINVAAVKASKGYGRASVTFEQLVQWDPDVIIICNDEGHGGESFFDRVYRDPLWTQLRAVKNHAVYEIPYLPFNWFDRPPSVNRLIGMQWLTNLLYPDTYRINIKEETKKFYEMFYHRTLSNEEVNELLTHAER